MPNFETFTKRMVPLTKRPAVTIQKRGTISINKAAFAAMGSPEAVELLFDREEQIVGFRPVDKDAAHAYAPRGVGRKEDATTYIIAGQAFTQYYGIDTSVSRRWPAAIEGDILCINLKDEHAVVTSNRSTGRAEQTRDGE